MRFKLAGAATDNRGTAVDVTEAIKAHALEGASSSEPAGVSKGRRKTPAKLGISCRQSIPSNSSTRFHVIQPLFAGQRSSPLVPSNKL